MTSRQRSSAATAPRGEARQLRSADRDRRWRVGESDRSESDGQAESPGSFRQAGDLTIDQDLNFERRSWRLQRVAWVIGTLVLIAALAGVFGHGPMSDASVESSDGALRLDYSRLTRSQSPSDLNFEIGPTAPRQGGQARLWIDRAFLNGSRIDRITPEPAEVATRGDRMVYTFHAPEGATAHVRFHLDVESLGSRAGAAGLLAADGSDGPSISFRQFVYP